MLTSCCHMSHSQSATCMIKHDLHGFQDAVGSDDEALEALSEFTALFAAYRYGHYSLAVTRNLAVNLLNDCAPATIEEFLSLCHACATSDAWAGVVTAEAVHEDLSIGSGQLQAASEPLTPASGVAAHARGLEEGTPGHLSHAHPSRHTSVATGFSPNSAAAFDSVSGRIDHEVSWRERQQSHNGASPSGAAAAAMAGGGASPSRRTRRNSSSTARHGKKKDWLSVAKTLVPYGRGAYAIWFTILNMVVIVGIYAYMTGDYAMWARRHPSDFESSSTGAQASDLQVHLCLLLQRFLSPFAATHRAARF